MTIVRRTLSASLFVLASCATIAAPQVLIFQHVELESTAADLDDYLAQQLHERGRVKPIVWSMTDPIFRVAVLDGKIRVASKEPTAQEIAKAGDTLGCEFVLVLSAARKGADVAGKATLRQRGRDVWSDVRTVSSVRESAQDLDNVVRSLAGTWAMLLEGGPFKPFVAQPRTIVPEPPAGEVTPIEEPPKPAVSENAKLFAEAAELEKSKRIPDAISALRDGVDAQPLDPDRRIRLVELLIRAGRPVEAAEEARRSTQLLPTSLELRTLASAAWMRAGRPDEAAVDLAETIARDPNNAVARRALGEIALGKRRAAEAIGHFDRALASEPTPTLHFLRALAKAMAADQKGLAEDFALAAKLEGHVDGEAAQFAARTLDDSFDFSVNDVRSLMQRALVRRHEIEVVAAANDHAALAGARRRFLELWLVPTAMGPAHGKRQLATNLLAQALGGLKAFLADGVEDTLSDARIDLGEAIRQAKEVRKLAESGIAHEVTDGRTTNGLN